MGHTLHRTLLEHQTMNTSSESPIVAWTTNPDEVILAATKKSFPDIHIIRTTTGLTIYDAYEHALIQATPDTNPSNAWHLSVWLINTEPSPNEELTPQDIQDFILPAEVFKADHPQPNYTASITPELSYGRWTLSTLKGLVTLMAITSILTEPSGLGIAHYNYH
jgi:hypothetical protein